MERPEGAEHCAVPFVCVGASGCLTSQQWRRATTSRSGSSIRRSCGEFPNERKSRDVSADSPELGGAWLFFYKSGLDMDFCAVLLGGISPVCGHGARALASRPVKLKKQLLERRYIAHLS